MKQRFIWLALLLIIGHIGVGAEKIDCSDIVQKFSKKPQTDPHALTITPMDDDRMNDKLVVEIEKTENNTVVDEKGIQIYLALDRDSECGQQGETGFTISRINEKDEKKKCAVKYSWDGKDSFSFISPNDPTVKVPVLLLFEKPYQAAVELRKVGNDFKLHFTYPKGPLDNGVFTVGECWDIDDHEKPKIISFQLEFEKINQCGIQLEMKKNYDIKKATLGKDDCDLNLGASPPSSEMSPTVTGANEALTVTGPSGVPTATGTNEALTVTGSSGVPNATGTNETLTTTPSGGPGTDNAWIIALAIILALIVIAIIGLVIYFIYRRKHESDEDVEGGEQPEMETTQPSTTGTEAESTQHGSDGTQNTQSSSE